MKNIYQKPAKIIFIEGAWGSGKTTLIGVLKKISRGKIKILKEPNHLSSHKKGSLEKITDWYMNAHYKNINKAIELVKKNHVVIVERSPISCIAFMEAYLNKNKKTITKEVLRLEKELLKISTLNTDRATFLYLKNNTPRALARLNSRTHLKPLASEKLLSTLSRSMDKKIIGLKKKGIINLQILKNE